MMLSVREILILVCSSAQLKIVLSDTKEVRSSLSNRKVQKVYFAHSQVGAGLDTLEIDNLGHFLFFHDFPMLDDTIVHFFFKMFLVKMSFQCDLFLGIFFSFSWTLTFQMFNATAKATPAPLGVESFGIVRASLGQVSSLAANEAVSESVKAKNLDHISTPQMNFLAINFTVNSAKQT